MTGTQNTQNVIEEMLKENTGTNFLDSGGTPQYDSEGNYVGSSHGYGRNYERNQGRDFQKEKPCSVSFSGNSIEFQYSTYHWLNERCELAETENELFYGQFLEESDDDKTWPQLMEEFPEWLSNHGYSEPTGIYGEGEPIVVNTYNEENLLDQVIQFVYFTNEEGEFAIIQTHNGADVRGGYSKPQIFRVGNKDELDIFESSQGTIYCTGKDHHPEALKLKELQEAQLKFHGVNIDEIDFDGYQEHYWYTDDGYHWYPRGCCGKGYTQLEDYEFLDVDEEDSEGWKFGVLCIKDGIGYCPICGAKLEAGS